MTQHCRPAVDMGITVSSVPYDGPEALLLTLALHDEQRQMYGFADHPSGTPAADYRRPHGAFLVIRTGRSAVACGGWRTLASGTAEIKRMYVRPEVRQHGIGRSLLTALERDAAGFGARRIVLETGVKNLGALELYRRTGYRPVAPYVPGRDPAINRALAKDICR
ncbi:GNAT family N-acetyltransferase [Streptomyces xiamenensis]|uniref:GNAT family N-acetyltransferase n=1 Tax=Streptomyces xiamenensis TaxID=408015 RepID=UPI0035DCD5FB